MSPRSDDVLARRRSRFRGALLGVVVGDSLGAAFEGHPGPVPAGLLARVENDRGQLRYTDDTAMTFALAESLLACGALDLDHLSQSFASTFEAGPLRGYGAGTAQLLARVVTGEPWREAAAAQFDGRGSFGNGAAMRVAPVALFAGGAVDAACALGRASATVTHTHAVAVDAAGVQAAAVALALGARGAWRPRLVRHLVDVAQTAALKCSLNAVASAAPDSSPADVAAITGTGVAAVEALPAAIAAVVLNSGSFPNTMRYAITMGGDTDTIAAMAGGVAGACLGEDGIPTTWIERMEGTRQAVELADRLADSASWGEPPPCDPQPSTGRHPGPAGRL